MQKIPFEPFHSPLVRFCHFLTLPSALHAMQLWEDDQQRFGFGTVLLSYTDGAWVVWVSKDLHDAALPF